MTTYQTIIVQSNNLAPAVHEFAADAAITPGHLCELTATGIKVHATADGPAIPLVALESPFQGSPSSTLQVETAYAQYNRVPCIFAQRGMVLNMLLATSNNAVLNSPLVSVNDGTLKVVSVGTSTLEGAVVGYAAEAYNNTSGSPHRLLVRIA